ncbi:MAG: serine hydrolase domain-containing protein [Longimicrobiales bacterium]|nr:serine hydrolase domain-containing protein [Longimicrobiales bacterium]
MAVATDVNRVGTEAGMRATNRIGVLAAAVLLAGVAPPLLGAQDTERARLVAKLDSLARAHVADSLVAGAAVGVVHRGDTLLLAGFGVADLEWDVPTSTDAVFEIGSVTKQFTAASVLQLVEQGKLDLDADVATYLPDYDTRGRRIPLRRLLDHTSGIKGYTEMPVFGEFMMRDLPRDSLVAKFEAEPLDFEPGTAEIYNNSAYFLLGLIIEKASGEKYEEYVKRHLFEPLGMARSYYCDERAVVPRRAHGYDQGPQGLGQKGYLDHQWPYAAGSLCSTAGDMVRWNQALHGGKVLSAASYRDMTTPDPLEDGTPIRYGMGLMAFDDNGRRALTHGGGINGFLSDAWYYPDEGLIVVVLQNSAGQKGPGLLARALIEAAIGPGTPPAAGTFEGDLSKLAGTYRGPGRGREMTVEVSVEGGALAIKPVGAPTPIKPLYRDGLRWQAGNAFWMFDAFPDGRASALRMDTGGGHFVLRRVEG